MSGRGRLAGLGAGSSPTGRMTRARRMVGRQVATALALVCSMSAGEARAVSGWEVYGGDPGGMRYSPLDQIDRSNVARLEVAWRYRTGELGEGFAARGKHGVRGDADPGRRRALPVDADRPRDRARSGERARSSGASTRRSSARGATPRSPRAASPPGATPTRRAGAPCALRIFIGTLDGAADRARRARPASLAPTSAQAGRST